MQVRYRPPRRSCFEDSYAKLATTSLAKVAYKSVQLYNEMFHSIFCVRILCKLCVVFPPNPEKKACLSTHEKGTFSAQGQTKTIQVLKWTMTC